MSYVRRISRKIKVLLVGTLVLIGVVCTVLTVYSDNTVKGISDSVIRLHIIAESDSDIDQEVKLQVRDAIMEYLEGKVDLSDSVAHTVNLIKVEMPNIEEVAKDVLVKNGHPSVASAEYGNFAFPTKQYENIELPAGNYNALRVTLGEGAGKNWWCVIFPPLCFADSNDGKISEEADAKLKESLSEDQYGIITSTDEDENVPVRFKFKLVEMVENTKNAIAGLFAGIFG